MLILSQVRTEDTDNMVMLVKHVTSLTHPVFVTTSTGNYQVQEIQRSLTHAQREYITICYAFTGCDTVSSIFGHGKYTLFKKLCETSTMYRHLNVFNSPTSTNAKLSMLEWQYFSLFAIHMMLTSLKLDMT